MIAVSAYVYFRQGQPPTTLYPMAVLVLFALLSFASGLVFLWWSLRSRDLVVTHSNAQQSAELRLSVATEKLNEILALDYAHCIALRGQAAALSKEELKTRLNVYLAEVLTRVTALFREYTGGECAACIKILLDDPGNDAGVDYETARPDSDPIIAKTFARDPASRLRRAPIDNALPCYPFEKNAAFAYVMHSADGKGYYFENDLLKPAAPYWSAHREFQSLYTATAVAALKDPQNEEVLEALGFICVDNKSGGFDNGPCRQILESIASIVYYTLRITTAHMNSRQLETVNETRS